MIELVRYIDGDPHTRVDNAISFYDGRIAVINYDSEQDAFVTEWSSNCQNDNKDDWGIIYEDFKASNHRFLVTAGETSYGGCGFVAVYDQINNHFMWLAHSDKFNNVKNLVFNEQEIVLRTDRVYPDLAEFRFPIESPEEFTYKELNGV